MKKMNLLKYILIYLVTFITTTQLYADQTQPKFTIIPSTQTKWVIPSNGSAQVIYTVTNQTKITRTLTMRPIQGITQTTGTGVCGSTFTLAHGQSCQLVLPLIGTQLSGHITQGPVICKTNGHGDNSPDPFLCSQPSRANSLDITSVGFEFANISVNKTSLAMIVAPLGLPHSTTLTVTNNSLTVTASNINTHFPAGWENSVVQPSTNNCQLVSPGHTCSIVITQKDQIHPPQNVPIYGDNTTQPTVLMSVVTGTASLSVSPASIILQDGGVAIPVTVKNTSTSGVVAHDVTVYLTRLFSDAGVTANPAVYPSPLPAPTYCPSLNPQDTCIITFTPPALGDRVVPSDGSYSPVPIRGSNTTEVNELVKLEYLNATIDAQPRSLALSVGSTTPQSIKVTNISSPSSVDPAATDILTTTQANFSGSPLSSKVQMTSDCTNSLPRGSSCFFYFTPIAGQGSIGQTFFNISGSNTNEAPVSISVSGAILNWSDSSVVVQNNSIVLATQGIFTPASGATTAQSKSRNLTVYNTGVADTLNVTIKLKAGSPPLPNGTTIRTTTAPFGELPTSCGVIKANGGSCTITISPGTAPSIAPPSTPVPTTIEVTDDLTNTITADITLLTYGNEYENGFVYWIDDVPDLSASVSGRVVARSNETEDNIVWNSEPGCQTGACTNVNGTNISDGFANTALIINTLNGKATTPYAAQICYDKNMSNHEWYLPAACELGYGSASPVSCGTSSIPAFQNIMSNAPQNPPNNYTWSSTANEVAGITQGVYVNAMIAPTIPQYYLVDDIASLRCAKKFGSG